MWWYRDSKRPAAAGADPAAPRATARPRASSAGPRPAADLIVSAGLAANGLAGAVAAALAGRPRDPDTLLVMSLLVDSRIELADGSTSDGATWFEAEKTISAALGEPVRLYNRFARDFGDGYSARPDLAADVRAALDELRAALRAAAGVTSVGPRTARVAAADAAS